MMCAEGQEVLASKEAAEEWFSLGGQGVRVPERPRLLLDPL